MSNIKINSQNNNYNSNPSEIDYEQLAIDVFNEQNRVRSNPESYIEKLERATKFFKDKIDSSVKVLSAIELQCDNIIDFKKDQFLIGGNQ